MLIDRLSQGATNMNSKLLFSVLLLVITILFCSCSTIQTKEKDASKTHLETSILETDYIVSTDGSGNILLPDIP